MSGRVAYDPAISAQVQSTLAEVTRDVESLIEQRGVDVAKAMTSISAGDATALYSEKEQKWATAATEVQGIIKSVEKTLAKYDEIAQGTLSNAKNAVEAI